MPFEPSRSRQVRTLRFRLMAWNAVVVIITALVTLLGLREGVRITLIRELDQLLMEDVREIELSLTDSDGADSLQLQQQLDRKDAGHAQHKWFVQLFDTEGNTLYQSEHAPAELAGVKASGKIPQSFANWRYFDQRGPMGSIRVGSSLELVHADVGRIDRLVALAAGVVLLVAPACGYWLAGRATRPLNEMIETMSGLRPSQLDERLAIRGTGDELDRLSVAFNRLLDRIGNYLQDRRDFLANAAHELRTPLAAIRSSIEVALNKKRTSEEYETLLSEVIEESASLELLVNQLLLLSETDAEGLRVHTQCVRLDEMVEKAIDMFGGVAEYREITLSCPALPKVEVHGNPQHLRQVVYNLLDNALKFTPTEGRVQVGLSTTNGEALFSVRDTGIGVPADELPHLFDRFFRGARRQHDSSDFKGTGLGLSICNSIVNSHGGSIQVESTPKQGTSFTVRLPLADSSCVEHLAEFKQPTLEQGDCRVTKTKQDTCLGTNNAT